MEQELTAVFPEYRNRGIGRWVKAVMVEKLLAESPQTEVISTGNADMNEPMLKTNREMGFRPLSAHIVWQTPLDAVQSYLDERAAVRARE